LSIAGVADRLGGLHQEPTERIIVLDLLVVTFVPTSPFNDLTHLREGKFSCAHPKAFDYVARIRGGGNVGLKGIVNG
jgi:hypothetical protein